MRLSIFSEGDSVLLLGEGNFSFARNLFDHNLPIKITATCFDNGTRYKDEEENINYLKENNVRVFLDVDARNLHNHCQLKNEFFSKIIFNFPHAGGKMRIDLNRTLLRGVCESAGRLLRQGDALILSLCNGQGGTPVDNPPRSWNDTWQVAEMVAHGDFCLSAVEPFVFDNFPGYTCTGYRSKDTNFNLEGALVHIAKKTEFPLRIIDKEALQQRLTPASITPHVSAPYHYSYLYSRNPLKDPASTVSYFKNVFLATSEKTRTVNDEDVSVEVEDLGKRRCLRYSAMQIVAELLERFKGAIANGETVFYPGTYFSSDLCMDFRYPPLYHQFLIMGKSARKRFERFVDELVSTFATNRVALCEDGVGHGFPRPFEGVAVNEWTFAVDGGVLPVAHELALKHKAEAVVVHVEELTEAFFGVRDRWEVWGRGSGVSIDSRVDRPRFIPASLYPPSHAFDITVRFEGSLRESDVYDAIRLSAADLVRRVELIDVYESRHGWWSKCFRITYQSADEPLHRERAIDIHRNLIGKVLTATLPVTVK